MATSPAALPASSSRWNNAFIPQTSESWKDKPLCVDKFDQNCCAPRYDIEALVKDAYESGLQSHPGVKALKGYPCTSATDLESLADQLATMAQSKEKKPSSKSKQIPGAPENLDISNDSSALRTNVVEYCADLVRNVISYNYGQRHDIPQKEVLGAKFDDVFKYCSDVVIRFLGTKEVFTNSFQYPPNPPLRRP